MSRMTGKALAQSGATPGGPGPLASQLPVLFLAYSPVSKTTPPAGGERGAAFFTLGYNSVEEISAWEETFG